MTDLEIPESGAVFTFGKSRFANNKPSHFFIKNDPVIEIACGDEHTAVICKNGRVFTFGNNEWGQLGLGHNNLVIKPSCVKSLKPAKARLVACGRAHTVIVTEMSNIYTFGNNTDGQLGLTNVENTNKPIQIKSNAWSSDDKISKISAGSHHTAVLFESGKIFLWGSNAEGQLGDENITHSTTPTLLSITEPIKDISCGYYHTALLTENGEIYVFGDNENNKLTVSSSEKYIRTPSKLKLTLKISSISCGGNHTFALTASSKIIGFGSNLYGELGIKSSEKWISEPEEIKLDIDEPILQIACGESHTIFRTESGKLYTCGDNRHGKLCVEDNEPSIAEPKLLTTFINFDVFGVACGGCHTIITAKRSATQKNILENKLPPLQRVPLNFETNHNKNNVPNEPENTIIDKKMEKIYYDSMEKLKDAPTEISDKVKLQLEEIINNGNEIIKDHGIEKLAKETIKTVTENGDENVIKEEIRDVTKNEMVKIEEKVVETLSDLTEKQEKTLEVVEDKLAAVTNEITAVISSPFSDKKEAISAASADISTELPEAQFQEKSVTPENANKSPQVSSKVGLEHQDSTDANVVNDVKPEQSPLKEIEEKMQEGFENDEIEKLTPSPATISVKSDTKPDDNGNMQKKSPEREVELSKTEIKKLDEFDDDVKTPEIVSVQEKKVPRIFGSFKRKSMSKTNNSADAAKESKTGKISQSKACTIL